MEINQQPKHLHKHALPVLILIAVLLAVSALSFASHDSKIAILKGATGSVIKVEPTHHGLVKISSNDDGDNENLGQGVNFAETGRTAQLMLLLR